MMVGEFSTFMDGEDCRECESYEKDVLRLKNENANLRATIERVNSVIDNMGKHVPVVKNGTRSVGGVCCRNARVDMLVLWREQLKIAVAPDE